MVTYDNSSEESLDNLAERLQNLNSESIKYLSLRTTRNRLRKHWESVDEDLSPELRRISENYDYSTNGYQSRPMKSEAQRPSGSRPIKENQLKPIYDNYDIGFSDEFLKDTEKVDSTLRGRIYSAIGQISRKPNQAKGDTVKPLVGDFKGFWRFRIGDFRLVYKPDQENRRVTLIAFSARGSIYD